MERANKIVGPFYRAIPLDRFFFSTSTPTRNITIARATTLTIMPKGITVVGNTSRSPAATHRILFPRFMLENIKPKKPHETIHTPINAAQKLKVISIIDPCMIKAGSKTNTKGIT